MTLSEIDAGVLSGRRFSNEFFPRDDFQADLRPATSEEIAAGRTEYSHWYLEWLARDS